MFQAQDDGSLAQGFGFRAEGIRSWKEIWVKGFTTRGAKLDSPNLPITLSIVPMHSKYVTERQLLLGCPVHLPNRFCQS